MRNKTYGIVALLVCAALGMTAAPLAAADHTPTCSTSEDTLTFGESKQDGILTDNNHVDRFQFTVPTTQEAVIRFWADNGEDDAGFASFEVYAISNGSCSLLMGAGTLTADDVVPQGPRLLAGTYQIVIHFSTVEYPEKDIPYDLLVEDAPSS